MPNEICVSLPGASEPLHFTDTVRIGRAETNGIVLNDEVVSGEHLEVRRSGDGWELVDLGSTNGTFINGQAVARVSLGPMTTVRLGHGGPQLHMSVPGLVKKGGTLQVLKRKIVDRYLADDAPEDMSEHTQMIRAAVQERREKETHSWLTRIRHLRVAVGIFVVLSIAAGGIAVWQERRVRALRVTAGAVFNTMKSLELDVRRLEAASGPDRSLQERRARLEDQYNALIKTLGIYSDRTPAEVQLIYRTVHKLGESEANVPRGFVDEVRKYIAQWKAMDLQAGLARATAQDLGPQLSNILMQHNLPREFFYVALQESKLDPRAIGPATRLGVPKGLWQLIPPTAEAYGLRLGPLQGERTFDPSDERHEVAKSTTAAARYIQDIYTTDAQASGLLVMASYNMGETRLRALLRSLPESPAERNFWALLEKHRSQIPAETYNYVFRVVSAAVIGGNPKLFGFDFDPPLGSAPDSLAARAPK
ncbi:MAG: FHA domain-containing protein [Gemmatimonadaceae bacterium]